MPSVSTAQRDSGHLLLGEHYADERWELAYFRANGSMARIGAVGLVNPYCAMRSLWLATVAALLEREPDALDTRVNLPGIAFDVSLREVLSASIDLGDYPLIAALLSPQRHRREAAFDSATFAPIKQPAPISEYLGSRLTAEIVGRLADSDGRAAVQSVLDQLELGPNSAVVLPAQQLPTDTVLAVAEAIEPCYLDDTPRRALYADRRIFLRGDADFGVCNGLVSATGLAVATRAAVSTPQLATAISEARLDGSVFFGGFAIQPAEVGYDLDDGWMICVGFRGSAITGAQIGTHRSFGFASTVGSFSPVELAKTVEKIAQHVVSDS